MDKNTNYRLTPAIMLKAMQGEYDAIAYYKQLSELAPNEEFKRMIAHFAEDEATHLEMSTQLYTRLFKNRPQLEQQKTPTIVNFEEGLKQAFHDETDAYETYRNIYLDNMSPAVRNLYFKTMTDENEHALKIVYMLTTMPSYATMNP